MKKLIMAVATCLLVSLTHAKNFDDLDATLMEMGLVDENYRYTDIELVEMLFEEASTDLKSEKLNAPGEDPQLTDLTYTPYLMDMEFHLADAYSETDRLMFQSYFASDEIIQDGCSELYTPNKIFSANGFVIKMDFYDANHQPMGNIVLNNEVCY